MMSGVIETDPDYTDVTITGVSDRPDGWNVQHGHRVAVVSSEHNNVKPQVGETMRLYTRRGEVIRGIVIEGRVYRYSRY